jgi:hypothetical protein
VRVLLGILLVLLALPPAALPARGAPQVEVTMATHPDRFAVGDQFRLAVTVKLSSSIGSGRLQGPGFRDYRPPKLDDFEILRQWTNQSTQISYVGGRGRREEVYTYYYALRPRKAGRITISPASVRVQGQRHRAQPLTIQISPGAAAPPPTLPGQTPDLSDDEDLFVQVVPDKTEVWVGEQVTVTWYVYFSTPLRGAPTVQTPPNTDNFFSEELPFKQQQASRTTITGTLYGVLPIYRRALFPMKAGELEVGPLTVKARLRGRSWFRSSAVTRSSAPVTIRARALPKAGRPPDFRSGNVGQYRIDAEVDPVQIDANSGTTLQVTIAGTGFVHGLKFDKIKTLDGFRVRFATQRTEMKGGLQIAGKRVHEYVLIPRRTGTLEVKPICLSYFDPVEGRYRETCSKKLQVEVTGQIAAPASGAVTAGRENELRRRLKPILRGGSLAHRTAWRLHRSWIRWPLLLTPVLALALLLLGRAVRNRLASDTEGRRRREARGRARRRLRLASSYLKSGDRVGFFGEIANVIQEQLSARTGLRVRGLTSTELSQALTEYGVDPDLRDRLVSQLEECDFARFAPAAAETKQMEDALARTRRLLTELDRVRVQRPRTGAKEAHA